MAKGQLFEYAILYHGKPTKDERDNNQEPPTELVQDLIRVIAKSKDEVGILAARQIPEKYLDRLEQVEIIVRPFL